MTPQQLALAYDLACRAGIDREAAAQTLAIVGELEARTAAEMAERYERRATNFEREVTIMEESTGTPAAVDRKTIHDYVRAAEAKREGREG